MTRVDFSHGLARFLPARKRSPSRVQLLLERDLIHALVALVCGPLGRGRSLVLRAGDDTGGNESGSQETMQSSSSSSSSELESSFSSESRNAGADEPAKATAVCFRYINALKFAADIGVRMEVSQSSHR